MSYVKNNIRKTVNAHFTVDFMETLCKQKKNICSLSSLQTMALLHCPAPPYQKGTTRKRFL